MKTRIDFYQVLHVQPDAPTAVIKASYRALLREGGMHPDVGGDHMQATLLNEAFATLSNPQKRAAYDRATGRTSARAGRPTPKTPPPTAATSGRPASGDATAGSRPTASRPAHADEKPHCLFCFGPLNSVAADAPDAICSACGSALCAARRHHANDSSRRAIDRLPHRMSVTFRRSSSPDVVASAVTEDLSLNGMRVRSSVELTVGERVRVESQFCSAVAIVRGVATTGQSAADQAWLASLEFLTLRLKRERGGIVSTVA
jgi:curved DNA-binding protein CbpA